MGDVIAKHALIHNTLSQVQDEWQKEKNDLEEKLKSANAEIDNLKNDNGSLKANLKMAIDDLNKFETDNQCLNGEIILIKDEKQKLLGILSDTNQQNINLESELKLAKDKIKVLECKLAISAKNNESSINDHLAVNELKTNDKIAAIQNQLDELKMSIMPAIMNTKELYLYLKDHLKNCKLTYIGTVINIVYNTIYMEINCGNIGYTFHSYIYRTSKDLLNAILADLNKISNKISNSSRCTLFSIYNTEIDCIMSRNILYKITYEHNQFYLKNLSAGFNLMSDADLDKVLQYLREQY